MTTSTQLQRAARDGNLKSVKALIAVGADVKAAANKRKPLRGVNITIILDNQLISQ
jgi:hypothetical protein